MRQNAGLRTTAAVALGSAWAAGRAARRADRPATTAIPNSPTRAPPRDGGHRPARLQELHSPSPALFQLVRAPGGRMAHRPPQSE